MIYNYLRQMTTQVNSFYSVVCLPYCCCKPLPQFPFVIKCSVSSADCLCLQSWRRGQERLPVVVSRVKICGMKKKDVKWNFSDRKLPLLPTTSDPKINVLEMFIKILSVILSSPCLFPSVVTMLSPRLPSRPFQLVFSRSQT